MNTEQIKKLAEGIALLISAILGLGGVATTVAVKPVKVAPAAPSGEELLGFEAPAPVVAAPKAAPKAPTTGLIDLSTLTGLAKARAVAHNNRVNAAAAAAGVAPVAAPTVVTAPAAVVVKPAKVKPSPVVAPTIDANAIKNAGLALLKKDKAGGSDKLKVILAESGATNLTTLPQEQYAVVLAKLQAAVV